MLHTYYVSNAKSELKVAAQEISDEMIFSVLNNINFDDEFDIDEEETERNQEDELMVEEENIVDDDTNDDELQIENYFNLIDRELATLLQTQEVQVIIEPRIIDHGDRNFDLETLLQEQFD